MSIGLLFLCVGLAIIATLLARSGRKREATVAGAVCAVVLIATIIAHSARPSDVAGAQATAAPTSTPSMQDGTLPVVSPELARAATLAPTPRPRPIPLSKLRDDWYTSTGLILAAGDPIHGQIADLIESPDEARDYPLIIDPPDIDNAVSVFPDSWQSTRTKVQAAGAAIMQAREDFKRWKDGADLDDDLKTTLKADSDAIVSAMCHALADARVHYRAVGGYSNDLTFTLISDKGDRPCANVAMAHPYGTVMERRALVTIDESSNENPSVNEEQAFLNDDSGFIVPAGTVVQVIGHRTPLYRLPRLNNVPDSWRRRNRLGALLVVGTRTASR